MQIIEKVYKLVGTLKKRFRTNRIILHHAAAINCTADQIDSWHKARGWSCIGYHFFVRKDGTIYRGRPEDTIGAHASNNNSDSIGICAEGNFEIETMPEAQKQALKELVSYLKEKYNISNVQRHKDVGQTDCPGKNYPFDEIVNGVNIKYKVHVQNGGWQTPKENGELAGTKEQSLRMEAIKIDADIPIKYRVHTENKGNGDTKGGWSEYVPNGFMAGSVGESRRIEAIEIESSSRLIKAKAHIQNVGDVDYPAGTHVIIGTEGQALRLEALTLEFV